MEAFTALIREFGPFIVIYYIAFHGGPTLLKQIGSMASLRFQTQDTIALRGTDLTLQIFNQYIEQQKQNAASETAFVKALNDLRDDVIKRFDKLERLIRKDT